jgi:hypothetical protein
VTDGTVYIDSKLDKTGFQNGIKSMAGDAKSAFGSLRDVMQGPIAAAQMAAKAIGMVGAAVGKLTDASGQVEKYKATLTVMLGSEEAAVKRFKELSDFAAKTPFELPDVVELGNRLQSIGKYSRETMTDLGDLAAASGKPIDQVTTAFAKLATGQKGEAVNMFRDLLISTNDWVAATGKGVNKSGEMLATTEEMLVALPKILQSKNFSGMMATQAKTWVGITSNLNDAIFRISVTLGDILTGPLKGIVLDITNAIGAMDTFVSTNASLREEIDGWTSIMQEGWEMFKSIKVDPALLDSVKQMSESFRNLIENLLPLLGQAFSDQASSIGTYLKYIVDTLSWLADELSIFIDFYKALMAGDFKSAILNFILIILGWAEHIIDTLETIANGAMAAMQKVADFVNKILPKNAQIKIGATFDKGIENQIKDWERLIRTELGIDTKKGTAKAPKVKAAPSTFTPASSPGVKVLTADEQAKLKKKEDYEKKWIEKNADLQATSLQLEMAHEIEYANSIGADTTAIRAYYGKKIRDEDAKAEQENIKKISGWWSSAFSAISSGIQSIAGEGASGMSQAFSILSASIAAAASNFADVGADIQIVTQIIALAGENLPEFFAGIVSDVSALSNSLMTALGPIFSGVLTALDALLPIFEPIIAMIAAVAQIVAPLLPMIDATVQLYMAFSGLDIIIPLLVAAVQLVADVFIFLYNDVIRPVYNFLMTAFNLIYNGFAAFINSLLDAVDSIPFVDLSYRIASRSADQGTLSKINPTSSSTVSASSASALSDANKSLKENKELFTLASKAAEAYTEVLTGVTSTVSDFYDSLKDVGKDITGTIVDGLLDGLDNDDFLYSLEEYIKTAVVKAAVFSESFMTQVSSIGSQLASAISTGDYSAIESLKNQLSSLWQTANSAAQIATDAVSSAFGSYDVGSLGLPSDGLIFAHEGEGVIPAGLMNEAASRGLTIAPASAALSGSQSVYLDVRNVMEVDGREIARSAFKYQDDIVGAAYGG